MESLLRGTHAQLSCPGAHAQMAWLSASIISFLKMARALMVTTSHPPHFWVESVSTSIYLINLHPLLCQVALLSSVPLIVS